MSHLSGNQIYELAKKMERNVPFSSQDVDAVRHIGECESCCRLMKCMMAVMSVTDHMAQAVDRTVPVDRTVSAKVSLIADRIHPSLNQFCTPGMKWAFVPGAAAGAVQKRRIEDIDNSRTFVEYDPKAHLLTIQLDRTDGDVSAGFLRYEDGTMQKIAFEKKEDLYCVQVRNLKDGEYYIILEKERAVESRAAETLARWGTDRIRNLESLKNPLTDE